MFSSEAVSASTALASMATSPAPRCLVLLAVAFLTADRSSLLLCTTVVHRQHKRQRFRVYHMLLAPTVSFVYTPTHHHTQTLGLGRQTAGRPVGLAPGTRRPALSNCKYPFGKLWVGGTRALQPGHTPYTSLWPFKHPLQRALPCLHHFSGAGWCWGSGGVVIGT